MGQAYSQDLRSRVLEFVAGGGTRRAAARRFEVSPSFVIKLVARVTRTGSPLPGRRGGSLGKLSPHRDFVIARVKANPDMTMGELSAELEGRGLSVAPASLSRFLIRLGYRFKKNADGIRARTTGREAEAAFMDDNAAAKDAKSPGTPCVSG